LNLSCLVDAQSLVRLPLKSSAPGRPEARTSSCSAA